MEGYYTSLNNTSGTVWPNESWEAVTRSRHTLPVSVAVVRTLHDRFCEHSKMQMKLLIIHQIIIVLHPI